MSIRRKLLIALACGSAFSTATLNAQTIASYTAKTASNLLVQGTLNGVVPPLSGGLPRWLVDKLQDYVTILDFGGKPDGSADVGPLINAAISAGFRTIHLPCGTYRLASPITSMPDGTSLLGDGACTIFSVQLATGDLITSTTSGLVTLRDFQLRADVVRAGGYAVHFYNTFHNLVEHVYLTNGPSGLHYSGIHLDGANDTHIHDVEMRGGNMTSGRGILVDGTTQRSEDTYISLTNINSFNVDVELEWSSGAYLSNMDILGAAWDGVLIDPSSVHEVDGLRAALVLSDSNIGNGWDFSGAGPITETSLTNCWGSSNGDSGAVSVGLSIGNSKVNNFTLEHSEFHANTGNGITVSVGSNISILGNAVFDNGRFTFGLYNGILVDTGASYVNVSFNMGGTGGIGGSTATNQAYGLKTVSTNYITAIGNLFNMNLTSAVSIASGTNVVNLGNGGN